MRSLLYVCVCVCMCVYIYIYIYTYNIYIYIRVSCVKHLTDFRSGHAIAASIRISLVEDGLAAAEAAGAQWGTCSLLEGLNSSCQNQQLHPLWWYSSCILFICIYIYIYIQIYTNIYVLISVHVAGWILVTFLRLKIAPITSMEKPSANPVPIDSVLEAWLPHRPLQNLRKSWCWPAIELAYTYRCTYALQGEGWFRVDHRKMLLH